MLILVINFYINGIKQASNIFKEAAGIFYEDRFVPLIESIVNIVFSLIFVKFFGLAGIFMGTICSSLVLICYSYPKYVYNGVLKDKILNYFKIHIFYAFICTILFIITKYICGYIVVDSIIVELIIKGILCVVVINLLYLLIVRKNNDFIYLKKLILRRK